MKERDFNELLGARWMAGKHVCVGLDSDYGKFPQVMKTGNMETDLERFNIRIIDATSEYACAFKLNLGFYLCHGSAGWRALRRTIVYSHHSHPDIPVIADGKWGDIGNTMQAYGTVGNDVLAADAFTLNPYMGFRDLAPFVERRDKGCFILCRTSNDRSDDIQGQRVIVPERTVWEIVDTVPAERLGLSVGPYGVIMPMYQLVAFHVAAMRRDNGNCGVVVGATRPEELAIVRTILPDAAILVPGAGAQKGDIGDLVRNGRVGNELRLVVNSSRGIIFASGGSDFDSAAETAIHAMHLSILREMQSEVGL